MQGKQLQGAGIALALVLLVVGAFVMLTLTRSGSPGQVAGDLPTMEAPETPDAAPDRLLARTVPPGVLECTPREHPGLTAAPPRLPEEL